MVRVIGSPCRYFLTVNTSPSGIGALRFLLPLVLNVPVSSPNEALKILRLADSLGVYDDDPDLNGIWELGGTTLHPNGKYDLKKVLRSALVCNLMTIL